MKHAADENALELIKRSDKRFSARQSLDTFRQEIAYNFAPTLACFTTELNMGDDFAAHLADSTPLMLARDFVGQIGAMLRPPGKQYFWHRTLQDDLDNSIGVRAYLDWRSRQMMRIMTDRKTGHRRACKSADEQFGLFGDAVISVDYDRFYEGIRVESHHVKDTVWTMGPDNTPIDIARRESITAANMKRRFGEKNLHAKVLEVCDRDPDRLFEIRHFVLPAEEYDRMAHRGMRRQKGQWASIWADVENKVILRQSTQQTKRYVLPGWVRPAGWSYSISPATTIALPDARMINQQALAIYEAAELSIAPPLIAYKNAIRGDVSLRSNDITWVDRNYDAKTGQPVEPLELGKNFGLGVDSLLRTENQLAKAFYLDVLRLPDTRNSKSTIEVQFLIDEYVRAALPLFEPIQAEYNDALLYEIDQMIELVGGYEYERPEELQGVDLSFAWDNPLSEMIERQQAQKIGEVSTLANTIAALEQAVQASPAVAQTDTKKMYRDGVIALGGARWLLDEDEANELIQAQQQQQAMQSAMAAAPDIAKVIDSGMGAARTAAELPLSTDPGIPLMPEPV